MHKHDGNVRPSSKSYTHLPPNTQVPQKLPQGDTCKRIMANISASGNRVQRVPQSDNSLGLFAFSMLSFWTSSSPFNSFKDPTQERPTTTTLILNPKHQPSQTPLTQSRRLISPTKPIGTVSHQQKSPQPLTGTSTPSQKHLKHPPYTSTASKERHKHTNHTSAPAPGMS